MSPNVKDTTEDVYAEIARRIIQEEFDGMLKAKLSAWVRAEIQSALDDRLLSDLREQSCSGRLSGGGPPGMHPYDF